MSGGIYNGPDGQKLHGDGKPVRELQGESELAQAPSFDILCFGCIGVPGHFMHSHTFPNPLWDSTPWRRIIDGGLAPREDCVDGRYIEHHKDGWTAVAFWDRSGDRRRGSNTAFFVAATMTGDELIALARQQWPEVFTRRGFPVLSNTKRSDRRQ